MAITTTGSAAVSMEEQNPPWQPQVFINFRGADLRVGFISYLQRALRENNIKYYIDCNEIRSESIDVLFKRIQESQIALVIFSKLYATSEWCLDELVEIMKNMEKGSLRVIPVFFKVNPDDVTEQKREFGVALYGQGRRKRPKMPQWEDALEIVPTRMGLVLKEGSSEDDFLVQLVEKVKEVEAIIISESTKEIRSSSSVAVQPLTTSLPPYEQRLEQQLEQLEERFGFDTAVTRIFGIVGMAGIGKTTLAKGYFDKCKNKIGVNKIVEGIHERSKKELNSNWLMEELLDVDNNIFKRKCFIFLDDVSEKKQIESLLSNVSKIKQGSKIVITTRDKSWISRLAHDTFVVPGLNENEALQLFRYHAFNNQECTNFTELSKRFVDYGGGNPRALEELGKELFGKNEAQWGERLETLPHCCNVNIKRELRISYDQLTQQQQDAFLDIACFFISEDEDCVASLLASKESPESGESARKVRDLAEKFMISVKAGQIEMHNLMSTMGKEIGSSTEDNLGKSRLWNQQDAINALVLKKGTTSVRGILLDVSKLKDENDEFAIAPDNLTVMPNLRYLKIFDSSCPRQCKVVDVGKCKVHLPDDLDLPLKEIRYLHWLKFPLEQLPSDFEPENLIDLRLPYSKIQRIWEDVKDTPKLKWVDLSHSAELVDLSALSKAENLQRLNLEGCIMLEELPEEMENMKSLVFLNLKGCTSLLSLPHNLDLISLKTLILSDCSEFNDFQVISKNLEYLHLDGTRIKMLPEAAQHLGRLIVLNLKDCKMLESLPNCLGDLKALEELILSGCSRLSKFPEIKQKMENLQILLLDRTKIKDVPKMLLHCAKPIDQVSNSPQKSGLSLLRRLCLSRNDIITHLNSSISELHHLKWIDLKYCKKLISISTLPPNLQCLDAHECTSLKTVASPLARLAPTEHVPSSFIFTNCGKLEHVAKNEITCYGHNKGRLLSETLNRHNKGFSFEALVSTCFPGSEVPTWFGHKASGAVLEPELPQHWTESGFVGVALCAVVSFEDKKIQNNNLQVKCMCDFNNVKTSSSYFNCPVGGLSETGNEQRTIKSTHVFIGYTNWLNIKKCQEEDGKKGCVPTMASIKFQVTDDIGEVSNCDVIMCGFSLVYESGSWEASSRKEDVEQGEFESFEMNKKFSKMKIASCGENIMRENEVNSEASCSSTTS